MFLHGIESWGRHGVLDFERRDGQRFIIDLDWWIDTEEARSSDGLDATVCYQQLFDAVQTVVGGEPWHLIETLCDQLITALLAAFSRITTIEVTVHKPEAPIRGVFSDVGIVLRRHRRD